MNGLGCKKNNQKFGTILWGKKWELMGNLCTFVSVNGGNCTETLINRK